MHLNFPPYPFDISCFRKSTLSDRDRTDPSDAPEGSQLISLIILSYCSLPPARPAVTCSRIVISYTLLQKNRAPSVTRGSSS